MPMAIMVAGIDDMVSLSGRKDHGFWFNRSLLWVTTA
jgi:hypothetical protein